MTDLQADITRIAALRGRPAANYVAEAERIDRQGRRVTAGEIVDLFQVPGDVRLDFRAFDRLPEKSREALRELPLNASAVKYADMLVRMGQEAGLIYALHAELGDIVKNWVLRHFGATHPRARRL